MTPEESLRRIPGFSQAAIIRQISAGPVSDGFLVEHGGSQYVLRIDRPTAAALGLDRDAEATIVAAMVVLGLSWLSGVLLTRYSAAALPYLDSFTTWGAIVTTWMVAWKSPNTEGRPLC